jgi:hypothetical protein
MKHPYAEYEQTPLWRAIDAAISELERNRDVELTTAREYVIGYLCQQLAALQVVASVSKTGE